MFLYCVSLYVINFIFIVSLQLFRLKLFKAQIYFKCGLDPRVRHHPFVEIGHEIISTAILSLPLVVNYWRKDVHLVLVNRLGRVPRNSVVKLTDRLETLDMTIS